MIKSVYVIWLGKILGSCYGHKDLTEGEGSS